MPLPEAGSPRRLADVHDRGARRRLVEELPRHEPIVEHDLGVAETSKSPERDQLGVARPGTDEGDAGVGGPLRTHWTELHASLRGSRPPPSAPPGRAPRDA